MQTVTARTESAPTRAAVFLMYLVGGLAIFWLGANTFDTFPTNRNPVHGDMQFLAVDKLSQAIPIVATIVLLSVRPGDDLRGLFLTQGRLRQGLRFGLASFAGFAAVFAVIVVIQADALVTQGLVASGVRPDVVLAAAPWILVFCFANAFMEELWFRGVALRKLVPLLGGTASIVVTAPVFGLTHAAATYVTAVQALLFAAVVVALGVVNAAVMLKTESIWGSVLFHAGYDLLVILPLLVT